MEFLCSNEAFCIEACIDNVAEMKIKNPSLNGYFAGAEYSFENDVLTISLKHGGYKKICECEFQKKFKLLIKQRYNRNIDVNLTGQLEDVEMVIPEPEPVIRPKVQKSEGGQKPSTKVEITFDKRDDVPQNGMVYLDNPKTFYGRNINTNTKPMIEVTEDDREISCWGEVFGKEIRTINTKRGESNILSFAFSDYTNSINCSMFVDPKKMDTVAEVKDGNFLLIRGFYEFDNYKKDFILKPNAMAVLQSYKETDDYEGDRRVELHCHTNNPKKMRFARLKVLSNKPISGGIRRLLLPTTVLFRLILPPQVRLRKYANRAEISRLSTVWRATL